MQANDLDVSEVARPMQLDIRDAAVELTLEAQAPRFNEPGQLDPFSAIGWSAPHTTATDIDPNSPWGRLHRMKRERPEVYSWALAQTGCSANLRIEGMLEEAAKRVADAYNSKLDAESRCANVVTVDAKGNETRGEGVPFRHLDNSSYATPASPHTIGSPKAEMLSENQAVH